MNTFIGRIFWSRRSKRFYQEGRRGAVSRERAMESLTYDEELDRFRDQRGVLVDNRYVQPISRHVERKYSGQGTSNNRLTTEIISDRLTETQARSQQLKSNQFITARITVVTEDGRTHTSYWSTKTGRPFNPRTDLSLMQRHMRSKLINRGYNLSTNQIGSRTQRVDFVKKTVKVIR